MRLPIERNSQPSSRVMPSSAKPDSVIRLVTLRSSQFKVSDSVALRPNTGSLINPLMVRQLSSDMRSRRLKATRSSARRFAGSPSGCVSSVDAPIRATSISASFSSSSSTPKARVSARIGVSAFSSSSVSCSFWFNATRSRRAVSSQRS